MNRARLPRRRHGLEIIEMTMSLTILFALVFGGVEFGCFIFTKHAIQAAAREGARTAALVGSTNTDIANAVSASMQNAGLSNSGYALTVSPTDITTAVAGSQITVTVTCTWGTVGQGLRPMALISTNKVMTVSVSLLKEG